ncbi:MAG: ribonuclease HIII [Lentisphaeria bacterium]|jgi:ribonuclease HIII
MPPPSSHVCTATPEQIAKLRELLTDRGWTFSELPYGFWKAAKEKTTVAAYHSGKLSIQGKGTADLVQFLLEPEVLHEARFGYETELKLAENPAMLQPHAGIDESGKGDYFGPLVIAAAFVDEASAPALLKAGVADSKTIKGDRRIFELETAILAATAGRTSVVTIGPEAYNRLHAKFGNVNRLLAWGHARALENLLEKVPDCPRAISDQFGAKELVQRALLDKGRRLALEQMHRAEADVAVAAASILARAEFIRRLERLGQGVGVSLPRGAGPQVKVAAGRILAKGGRTLLETVTKMHFKTTAEVLLFGGPAEAPPPA